MNAQIQQLYDFQQAKRHHAWRRPAPADISVYRDASLPPEARTSKRLALALACEEPVLFPGELIAFTRTVLPLPRIFSDEEWAGVQQRHCIRGFGNVNNLCPDYAAVIGEGLLTVRSRLGESVEHCAMRESIDALLLLTKRYRQLAEAQGDQDLAAVLARVPAYGARSFREALQSLRILHFCLWVEGSFHNTLGRFDQYMLPYLERDLASGALDEEEAFALLEAFFLSCNRDSDLYPGMQLGDNGQSLVLGGRAQDGSDGFHRLSEMCLRASADLRLIDPKINLRVHSQTPPAHYVLGTELTRLGLGFPQYVNDDVIIPGLLKLGYREEDAYNYAIAACWEIIIPRYGAEVPNIAHLALANEVDSILREKLTQVSSMEELLTQIRAQFFKSVRESLASVKNLYYLPSPFLSLFFDGYVENSRDISLGCRYNHYGFHGTGIAVAADMLAAVDAMVFQNHLPPQTLLDAMMADFDGYAPLRHELVSRCPKAGNDDDRADQYITWLLEAFADAVEGLTNDRGGRVRAGTGSALYYIRHAASLGSTADGRRRGTPLPANYAPSLGVRLNGPLSLILSFTKTDLTRTINGGPLTIEFAQTVFANRDAVCKVATLVERFMKLGGHQLQLNTLDKERLLDAQKHPDKHRNLIVRVWGWSGYFVELDKCYQDHIIARCDLTL